MTCFKRRNPRQSTRDTSRMSCTVLLRSAFPRALSQVGYNCLPILSLCVGLALVVPQFVNLSLAITAKAIQSLFFRIGKFCLLFLGLLGRLPIWRCWRLSTKKRKNTCYLWTLEWRLQVKNTKTISTSCPCPELLLYESTTFSCQVQRSKNWEPWIDSWWNQPNLFSGAKSEH